MKGTINDPGIGVRVLYDPRRQQKADRVRTPAGVRRYKQPIGSLIIRDREAPPTIDTFAGWLQARHPDVEISLHKAPAGHFVLHMIRVSKDQRGQGKARAALTDLAQAADYLGVRVALTPEAPEGERSSKTRLTALYREFGFVTNTGRQRDSVIFETMRREPIAPKKPAPTSRSRRRAGKAWVGYKPGRDMTSEMDLELRKQLRESSATMRYRQWDLGDLVLADLTQRQGWDAPGNVGSAAELDTAIAGGGIEVWRGSRGLVKQPMIYDPEHFGDDEHLIPQEGWEAHSVAHHLAALRTGKMFFGFGMYGNGIYTSVDREVAESYGEPIYEEPYDPQRGYVSVGTHEVSIQRMVIKPDARIVDYDDLVRQGGLISQVRPLLKKAVRADASYVAALLGYDLIRIRGQHDRDHKPKYADQYVILNRTAVLFEEPSK